MTEPDKARYEITVVLPPVTKERAETLAGMAQKYLRAGLPGTTVTLREIPENVCPGCGGDPGDNWFDRSVCPGPCNMMHTRCMACGFALDECTWDGAA